MHLVYQNETPPHKFSKSLFLAGPTLRKGQEGTSWRKEAIAILNDMGFDDGVVYLPENRQGHLDEAHESHWEEDMLSSCDCILFWLPCNMESLPCLSSRVEWGRYATSNRAVLGIPEDAEKMAYIRHDAQQHQIPIASTLAQTLRSALDMIGEGAERSMAERCVPLYIWKTPQFQLWYRSLLKASNRLEGLQVITTIGGTPDKPGIVIVRPKIYVAQEDRFKDEEVVISRTDLVSVCLWKETDEQDIEIVLIREVRSPVRNKVGYIYELPGGGAENEEEVKDAAIREIQEEVGLDLDEERLKLIGDRQVYGTLLSHRAHLFSYHLNDEEMQKVKSREGVSMGVKSEGEKTFVEVVGLSDIKGGGIVDWQSLGQICVAAGVI